MDNQIKKEVISILVDEPGQRSDESHQPLRKTRFQYRLPDGIDDQ